MSVCKILLSDSVENFCYVMSTFVIALNLNMTNNKALEPKMEKVNDIRISMTVKSSINLFIHCCINA